MREWVLLMLVACTQPEPEKPKDDRASPPMAQAEQDRGMALCTHYLDRVCACAEKDPMLADQCLLAKAQPEGIALQISLLHGSEGKLNDKERGLTEAAARKIVAACVKSDGALSPEKCPRLTN